jgi:hypothetical protein
VAGGGRLRVSWRFPQRPHAHLYETLALYLQQHRGEGRDGDAEKTVMVARWLAEASTSLQRGQYSVIMALAMQCRRVDPLTRGLSRTCALPHCYTVRCLHAHHLQHAGSSGCPSATANTFLHV